MISVELASVLLAAAWAFGFGMGISTERKTLRVVRKQMNIARADNERLKNKLRINHDERVALKVQNATLKCKLHNDGITDELRD